MYPKRRASIVAQRDGVAATKSGATQSRKQETKSYKSYSALTQPSRTAPDRREQQASKG
jgi:hypothetical protein